MHIPKKYFQDRFVLLLLSLNTFLTLFGAVFILLRLDTGQDMNPIVQVRTNQGLVDAYTVGNNTAFLSFILFTVLVLIFHTLLSMKVYAARRHFAPVVLGMGFMLHVVTIIVSNALLELR